MAWIAAIAAIGGSLISGMFSQSAAGTQAGAAQSASLAQLGMQQNAINQVAPWRQAGANALNEYSMLMGLPGVDTSQPAFANPFGGSLGSGFYGQQQASYPSGPNTGPPPIQNNNNYYGGASGMGSGQANQIGPARPGVQGMAGGGGQIADPPQTGSKPISPGSTPSMASGGGAGPTQANVSPTRTQDPAQSINQWLTQLPGYQFQLQQGTQAVENSAAARGMQLSSNDMHAIDQFGQGLAGTTFNQWLDRLNNLSTQGANAATGNATNIMQTSGMIGNNMIGAGNALAAGQVATGNALSSGFGDAANNYMWQNMMKNIFSTGGSGGGGGDSSSLPGSNQG
jgi:hypothetical protein